jgi:hypothetical protein
MNTHQVNKREPRRADDQHSTELASRILDRTKTSHLTRLELALAA